MSDFGDEPEKPDEPEETFEEAVFDASIPDDLSELESEGDQEVVLEEPNAAPEDYTQEEVMGIIKQRDDYLASLQRLQAEFENYKKRTQRQAEELSERGGEILAKRLIPALDENDPTHSKFDPRYRSVAPELIPSTECLKDVLFRMLPMWYDVIAPQLLENKVAAVIAHGNSIRALIKHLENISDDKITEYEIANGEPMVYELDNELVLRGRSVL